MSRRSAVRRKIPLAIALAAAVGSAGSCAPAAQPPDSTLATGEKVFAQRCASCHGDKGEGLLGPRLIGSSTRYPDIEQEIALITNGVKGTTMPAWKLVLSPEEIRAVAQYSRSLPAS